MPAIALASEGMARLVSAVMVNMKPSYVNFLLTSKKKIALAVKNMDTAKGLFPVTCRKGA